MTSPRDPSHNPVAVRDHVVLDAEALARLDEDTPRSRWVEALAKGGLLDRMAGATGDSEEGRILLEIRKRLVDWGRPARRTSGWWKRPAILAIGAMVLAFVLYNLFYLHSGFFFLFLLGPIGYRISQEQQAALPVPDEPGVESPRLAQLMRRLLQRSFVTVVDGAVVEHIPHCALLRTRLAEIDRAEAVLAARAAEIQNTRREIARVNHQRGHPVEDAETERLTALLEAERRQADGLGSMRAELAATLRRSEELLRELRMTAQRRALSERASRLAAGSAAAGEALAAAEVELTGHSARLQELADETAAADVRLRAMLELG